MPTLHASQWPERECRVQGRREPAITQKPHTGGVPQAGRRPQGQGRWVVIMMTLSEAAACQPPGSEPPAPGATGDSTPFYLVSWKSSSQCFPIGQQTLRSVLPLLPRHTRAKGQSQLPAWKEDRAFDPAGSQIGLAPAGNARSQHLAWCPRGQHLQHGSETMTRGSFMCHLQRRWASRGVASGGSIQAPLRAAYRWGGRGERRPVLG